MFYDPIQREAVLFFFKSFCKNKLNKNHNNRSFYANRDQSYIWDIIKELFRDTALKSANISQKIYHLYYNLCPNNIPCNKFVNFKVGYQKGHRHIPQKEITDQMLLFPILEKSIVVEYLRGNLLTKRGTLCSWVNDLSLYDEQYISSILHHTSNLPVDVPFKFRVMVLTDLCSKEDIICSECGSSISYNNGNSLLKTCNSKQCLHDRMSRIAIERKSYLSGQTKAARQKSADKHRGKITSESTRKKISTSLKKRWADPDFANYIKQKNRNNGVGLKISEGIKASILNGTFTPQSNNYYKQRETISSDLTGVRRYRSNWEKKFHEKNQHLLYEKVRIPYTFSGKDKIYIPDFVDIDAKIVSGVMI